MKSTLTLDLSCRLFEKHKQVMGHFDFYPGVVSMYGMARLAASTGKAELLEEIRNTLMPYVRGERSFPVNFKNYYCGGLGSSYLLWLGHLPEVKDAVLHYAEEILTEAPRDKDGILCHPQFPGEDRIWVDVAFSVGPFLLFAGLALKDSRFIDESVNQVTKMYRVLLNPENGLLHQCRGFQGRDSISEDHWCRGNGWMAFALAELNRYLPANHPRRPEVEGLFQDHLKACLNFQDQDGLWHQEMTEPVRSYVETSGSALLLYALGVAIETNAVNEYAVSGLQKSLSSLLHYISEDADVYHTCYGCLSPGEGRVIDYMAQRVVLNDYHGFGPIILAMGQAHALGLEAVGEVLSTVS
jgi:unsaturated rhamnogalacturonyl hydrolase